MRSPLASPLMRLRFAGGTPLAATMSSMNGNGWMVKPALAPLPEAVMPKKAVGSAWLVTVSNSKMKRPSNDAPPKSLPKLPTKNRSPSTCRTIWKFCVDPLALDRTYCWLSSVRPASFGGRTVCVSSMLKPPTLKVLVALVGVTAVKLTGGRAGEPPSESSER
jgi:hypothetical protein